MILFSMTSAEDNHEQRTNKLLELNIVNVAKGNKDALANIYEQTKAAVYGFALSILKNTHDAEDVLQDTYIHVFSAAGNYKAKGKPMAWIFTIAKNLCLMKIRAGRRNVDLEEWDWENIIAKQPDVTIEDKLVLEAARDVLTREENQIVMLHATTGLKHREIAELLQLPLPTVLSKYHRALKKLKTKLMEGGC